MRIPALPQEIAVAFGSGSHVQDVRKLGKSIERAVPPIMVTGKDQLGEIGHDSSTWDGRVTISREHWLNEVEPAFRVAIVPSGP